MTDEVKPISSKNSEIDALSKILSDRKNGKMEIVVDKNEAFSFKIIKEARDSHNFVHGE